MLKLCGHLLRNQARPLIAISVKQNINYLQIVSKPSQRCLPQRNASTSLAGPGAPSMKNEEKITPLGWFLMLIPVTTFGLGCWQVKRKLWKEQLIKDMETLTKIEPVDLPEDLSTLKDMEYRAVKVKGTFLHDKELLMGPRSFIRPDGGETAGGLFSQRDTGNGYWVITPFKLTGRDDVILINRGWISRKHQKPETRLAGQITDELEMTCVVRKGEQRPQFTPEHKGGVFLYRDLDKMSALTGAQPVFLDASYASSVPGGPIGGQTRITLRNDHLSYLITWYSLSLATAFLWYRTILKRKPF
ncbi:SURF1-like protein [Lucilia sericata]|uniref:SURF1-like protein n=1 Tax=Lucilia sericata TaxID=13632 RepID=UPI0018A80643|nr:SURF1-like protein [Lucilia sericata]